MRSLTRGKGIAAASSITTNSAWPSLCASDGWMYYKRRVDICYWFGGVKKVERLRTSLEVITICNVSIAIVKLRLISKKSPRVNNTEIMRNGIISVSPVSHCAPCAPQCPMWPIVSRVQLCPLCPLVSPVPNSVPCVPCVPLCLLCPLCPLVYLVSPCVSCVLLCPLCPPVSLVSPVPPVCPLVTTLSNCVPCIPYVPCVSLCSLCPLVSPVSLMFPVSPCVPCVPCVPLCPLVSPVSLVSPVYPCGMRLHFLRRWKLGCRFKSRGGYVQFFFFVFFLSSYFYPSACSRLFSLWPFFAPRDFCDNVCLVVGPCTSKTRKNIYLNCLPVFSKYIHSNNCFVEFRISWLHQLII